MNNMGSITSMLTRQGNKAANQFIISDAVINGIQGEVFQSYKSIIAIKPSDGDKVILDSGYWDFSVTTGQYRNTFLGEGITTTREKILNGTYVLANLNK